MNDDLLHKLEAISETMEGLRCIRHRPLIGGAFGSGRFVLASLVHVVNGLDEVLFFVREAETAAVVGFGYSKSEALGAARNVLTQFRGALGLEQYLARVKARQAETEAEERKRVREAEEEIERIRQGSKSTRSIPRRRRRIYEESDGKCHYCGIALTLDGKWHIEHKHPKALGGGNEPGNLVASCVPCNMKKRDRTDQEFIAAREKESAA